VTAQECVLAIDLGTQSIRAALLTADGTVVDVASRPVDLHVPQPGWAEQSPEAWWQATVADIRDVVGRNPEARVVGLGVGAHMHGVVPVDAEGRPLAERVGIWSDKRAADLVDEIETREGVDALTAIASNVPVAAWAGFKIAWFRVHEPDTYAAASAFLVVKDYITHRLTGARTTDPSEASGSFLMDASTSQWSDELLTAVGVDRRLLPEIVPSDAVVGTVTAEVAHATGLSPDVPVVAGGGDMLCQYLAAGVTRPGRVCEVSGTASIIAAHADEPSHDPRVMNLRAVSGGWLRFGIADSGGATFRWFVDRFCESYTEEAKQAGTSPFKLLAAEAEGVPPGSRGLLCLPYLLGERTMGSSRSRGSIIGLTPEHGRPEIVRAILEGVTFELRRTLDLVRLPETDEPVRVTGGGATSPIWNRIRANVYGQPACILVSHEGGLLGAGLLAGVGAGWYPDAAAAAEQVVRITDETRPDDAEREQYEEIYAEFCAVHDLLDGRWARWPAG
jgi:xylulokinase